MNPPFVSEAEAANEDENATTKDQSDMKPKGSLDVSYDLSECEFCRALYKSHSKRKKMENMEAYPENRGNEYPFCPTCLNAAEDSYKINLISESEEGEEEEEEEEDDEVGENSSSLQSTLTRGVFDAEVVRIQLAKMIIVDKLPLKIVEARGFRGFLEASVCAYNPEFEIPSVATVIDDIIEIYKKEKRFLRNIFVKQRPRVSLTIDTWTSEEDINYVVLTAHFIDVNWKLQRRILNFRLIENFDGETIGKEVVGHLEEWGIKKILTLTVNDACSNDAAIAHLVHHFKKKLVLGGKFVQVRCCAHILDLIVWDVIEDFHESISKIRNVVRFVRSCPERFSSFEKCIKEENISSKSGVCILDLPSRWDYTYMMLEGAEKFEKAFERLGIHEVDYLEEDVPASRDWEVARALVHILSVFYKASLRLGSLHVPANVVFHQISTIQNCFKKCSSNSDNLVLKDIAMKMQAKYDKHWGKNENDNYLLYLAIVLDPRYKLKFLSYCFSELFGVDVAKERCKEVENILRQLFDEYSLPIVKKNSKKKSTTQGTTRSANVGDSSIDDDMKTFDFKEIFDAMEEDTNVSTELEIYLLEPLVRREKDFDILKWWNYNSYRYKVLSKIARTILAIPVSRAASESAFKICGGVISPEAFSLAPDLVQALACTQSWLNKAPLRTDIRKQIEEAIRVDEEFASLQASIMKEGEKDD